MTALTLSAAVTSCGNKNTDFSETDSLKEITAEIVTENPTEPLTESVTENFTKDSTEIQTETSSLKAESLSVTSNKSAVSDLFSNRDLNPEYNTTAEITLKDTTAEISGSGVTIKDSVVTINSEGVYHITGKLSNGQIIVNAEKSKVQLILDNADINCSYS